MRRRIWISLAAVGAVALLLALVAGTALARGQGDSATRMMARQATPISADAARAAAEAWLDANGHAELATGEVVVFERHAWVVVNDGAVGAFDLIVAHDGTVVHPSPTMHWNERDDLPATAMDDMHATMGGMMSGSGMSGMMGGQHGRHHGQGMTGDMGAMMGGMHAGNGNGSCPMTAGDAAGEPLATPLTTAEALARAQAWLDANDAGAVAVDPLAFPGYVIVHSERDGALSGLLAVRTTTGAVLGFAHWGAVLEYAAG